MTNTLELKAQMIRRGFTNRSMAEAIGISPTSFSYKLNNRRLFNSAEIKSICRELGIDELGMSAIFFANNVE